ncbi:FAD-dependent oxidoreductase [Pseudorhodoplanes sinuspersici]|uniref:FAD-dependent oxidoreductase n=1 Tax=Pseudorhodoplanes sinuspersici TaxID=1235591 RepID=A0A1W6ZXY0_9HYPH|nr:FAD-dependent oxidoreductase [Pseudorhodoplanes sinuspersici]ARQ02180.1 FAD-dependent oxidoreductase [Pseudorhodoplanes sinuspersici]RKE73994.1 FAD dependent oxidoreductase [Pseudorhodoplanes sinuspersici]
MTAHAALHVVEPARTTPVYGEYDIAVLGGGPAGIAAAAAAAALGRKALLIERYGFLGGMGTAAGVTNFCGLHANVHGDIRQVVHGVTDDLLGRIDALGGLNAPHMIFGKTKAQAYDTAALKIAADDLLLSRNVDILFHAYAAGVAMDGARLEALLIETKSGRMAVRASVFIDCSGDGDLATFAGAPFEIGRGDDDMLYPTMMFRLNGVDPDAAGEAWKTIPALMDEAEKRGVHFPRKGAIVRPMKHETEWRVNVTQLKTGNGRALDGTDARELSAGEIEGRRQATAFFDFLKDNAPGFEHAYIVDLPPQLGIRETRRVIGQYQLSREDVLTCASFDDTVGVNGWPIEAHVAGDVKWEWPDIPGSRGYNHLPYRMLVPQQIGNLLVAGRCASMTHEGQSAARVSGACFVMGEAAATGAHLAIASGKTPANIDIDKLQETLERNGVFLGKD